VNSEKVGNEGSDFMASPLFDKSKSFALRIINVCNEIRRGNRTANFLSRGKNLATNLAGILPSSSTLS